MLTEEGSPWRSVKEARVDRMSSFWVERSLRSSSAPLRCSNSSSDVIHTCACKRSAAARAQEARRAGRGRLASSGGVHTSSNHSSKPRSLVAMLTATVPFSRLPPSRCSPSTGKLEVPLEKSEGGLAAAEWGVALGAVWGVTPPPLGEALLWARSSRCLGGLALSCDLRSARRSSRAM